MNGDRPSMQVIRTNHGESQPFSSVSERYLDRLWLHSSATVGLTKISAGLVPQNVRSDPLAVMVVCPCCEA
jgi:hypothetical protein